MRRKVVIFSLLAALVVAASLVTFQNAIAVEGDTLTRIVTTTNPESVLLAAGFDGLYRLDAGAWTRIGDSPPAGEVVSDGNESGVLLAGNSASCMAGGSPIDLQRSMDGGETWSPVAGTTGIRPLAIWSATKLALGASCSGLHLSTDLGETWEAMPGIDPGWDVTSFADVSGVDGGPVILVGLTGEGGTSFLHRIDLTDPAAPVVSDILREYYAIGGLAGSGDTFLLAVMDGAWLTTDAGATWTLSSDGLDGIVLERDPLAYGLPQDLDPTTIGLYAAALIPGTTDGFVVGSADGLYVKPAGDSMWTKFDGTSGKVDQVVVSAVGDIAYLVDGKVMLATLPS